MIDQLKEYGIYIILIAVSIVALVFAQGNRFGEYAALFFLKPTIKMLMVGLVAQFSFRRIDFQKEIIEGNNAAAAVFVGVCLVIAWTV